MTQLSFNGEKFRLQPMIGHTISFHSCEKLFDQSEFVLFIILIDNFPWSESHHVYNN